MIIRCPHCKKENEIEHVERGRHVECTCNRKFSLDDATVIADYSSIDQAPPEKIGQYKIERFIGRGGMGRVYKGIHPTLGIPVAVKTLLQEYAANPLFKERFIQSAKICAKMDHPNVVRVYDFGTTEDGQLYLVMEYIAGGTLYDMLQRTGPFTLAQVTDIAVSVCNGLAIAQKSGIVHRDIKPDNIMIASDGCYKLSDLGLAKYDAAEDSREKKKILAPEAADEEHRKTLELSSLGTPEYMAPEQAIDAKSCDIRADIYSLGITMYQLLTGRLPFQSNDPAELRRMHLEVEPKVPGEYRFGLPIDFEYIVMRCIQKQKTDRYQTPDELKADLTAWQNKQVLPSTSNAVAIRRKADVIEKLVQPPEKTWTMVLSVLRKEHRFFKHAAAALVLLLMLFVLFLVHREKAGTAPAEKSPAPAIARSRPLNQNLPQINTTKYNIGTSQDMQKMKERTERRNRYWQETKTKAEKVLKEKTNYASALMDLRAFEQDENMADQARSLIQQLTKAQENEVALFLKQLDAQAEKLVKKNDLDGAIAVYSTDIQRLEEESKHLREERIRKLQQQKEMQLEHQKKTFEYLVATMQKIADHSVEEGIAFYRDTRKNPEFHKAIEDKFLKFKEIQKQFANDMMKRKGKIFDCEFRSSQFDADLKEGNLVVREVQPPHILFSIQPSGEQKYYKNNFVFRLEDLTSRCQTEYVDAMQQIPLEIRELWKFFQRLKDNDFVGADFSLKNVPEELKEACRVCAAETRDRYNERNFTRDLLALLNAMGYKSMELPSPEILTELNIYTLLDPSDAVLYSQRLASIQAQYGESKIGQFYDDAIREVAQKLQRIRQKTDELPESSDEAENTQKN